jgi:hypothetical protein
MARVLLIDDDSTGIEVFRVRRDEVAGLLSGTPSRYEGHGEVGRGDALELHSLVRWTAIVVGTLSSDRDLRTLHEWARAIGASTGAIRNWCLTAHIPARRSLLFARVLRAVVRQRGGTVPPDQLLNVIDRRTLAKILTAAGGARGALPATLDEYLDKQVFVTHKAAVNEVRRLLRDTSRS